MKKELIPSLILTITCIIFFSGIYPLIVWGIAQFAPNKGEGFVIVDRGKKYYENVGQKFTEDKYFYSRPSAVDYNAAGSGGSNKAPTNPEYLVQVSARIDSFMVHNPSANKADIPSDIVTASGSGLDPDISVQAALVQIQRIAAIRKTSVAQLQDLVQAHVHKPLGLGPSCINVLKLNIDLDKTLNQ